MDADKIKILTTIQTKLYSLYEQIQPILYTIENQKQYIDDLFTSLKKELVLLHPNPTTIEDIITNASRINNQDQNINKIYTILRQLTIQHTTDIIEQASIEQVSKTYILETAAEFRKFEKRYTIIHKQNMELTEQLISYYSDQLIQLIIQPITNPQQLTVPIRMNIDKMHNTFIKYPLSIFVYANAMQRLVNKFSTDMNASTFLMQLLNSAKTSILQYKIQPIKFKRQLPSVYIPLDIYKLIPITTSQPLEEIIKRVLPTATFSKKPLTQSNLFNIFTKHKICCIILNKHNTNAIEYKATQLLNATTSEIPAITQSFLEQTSTITKLKQPATASKWNFDIQLQGASTAAQFVVLDSLVKNQYRILTPFLAKARFILQRHEVIDILNHISKADIRNPGMIDYYTMQCVIAELPHMFLKYKSKQFKMVQQSKQFDAKYIRYTIYIALMKLYSKQKAKPKTIKAISDFIHDNEIQLMFNNTLIECYRSFVKHKERHQLITNEHMVTFISYISHISISFIKEVHNQFEASIKHKQNADFKTAESIQSLVDTVLNNSLISVITNDSNIFQSVLYKDMIINVI